jgi:AcrR family transcriptional regulator
MARTVNEQEYAAKRNDILDAAQRLVYAKGYERMTIQDILADLQISSGAFYHYFASKPALLEALIERMQQEVEQPLLSIVHDQHLTALGKLQRFFATLDRSRAAQKTFLAGLLHVWFADHNAIVRQKVDEASVERRAPLLTVIVRQGLQEGVFTTSYPGHVAKVVLSLALGMGNAVARLLLLSGQERDGPRCIDDIVATYAAYTDAIERVLGAPSRTLHRLDAAAVKGWLAVENAETSSRST